MNDQIETIRLSSKELVSRVLKASRGEHLLLVYPELDTFRTIYPGLCKAALDENAVVLVMTYYEPVSRVFEFLGNAGIDVEENRRNGNLIVGDSVEEFFGKEKDLLLFLVKLERRIKEAGKSYLYVVVSMSAFLLYGKQAEMLEYEGLLDLSEVRDWKVLCCYHKADYDMFSEQVKQELVGRHNRKLFTI